MMEAACGFDSLCRLASGRQEAVLAGPTYPALFQAPFALTGGFCLGGRRQRYWSRHIPRHEL